jgi:hydrogenase maturation protease
MTAGLRVPRSCLVFAYGNPSRGDDALGPLLIDGLARLQESGRLSEVDLLTDFQLQVEHALDLGSRERVVFVDAAASGPEPFAFDRLAPEPETGYTTHAMRPGAVLAVYQRITGQPPPPAWLLAIRGYAFELGAPPSQRALANLEAAEGFLRKQLGCDEPADRRG